MQAKIEAYIEVWRRTRTTCIDSFFNGTRIDMPDGSHVMLLMHKIPHPLGKRNYPTLSQDLQSMIALSSNRNAYILCMINNRRLLPYLPKVLLQKISSIFYERHPFWYDVILFHDCVLYVEAAQSGSSDYFNLVFERIGPISEQPRMEAEYQAHENELKRKREEENNIDSEE